VSGLDPVETFRQEAQELLEQVEQGLLDLARRPGDRALIDAIFRGLHTLKGSGAMFGFDALAAFTHHCETAFDRVRKGEVPASPRLVGAVLAAQDHMRALAEGTPVVDGADDALLADLQAAVDGGEAAPVAAPPSRASTPSRSASACRPTPWSTARARCRCWTSCATWARPACGSSPTTSRSRTWSHRMPPGLGSGADHQARPRRHRRRLHLRDRRHDAGNRGPSPAAAVEEPEVVEAVAVAGGGRLVAANAPAEAAGRNRATPSASRPSVSTR
jgi:chemotaxis protein histidine kinase CheA